jgi:hypothetical protein
VWSPTFFLTLLEAIETRAAELDAVFDLGATLGDHALTPDKEAQRRLAGFLINKNTNALWPTLKLVSCWADASSKPFFDELRHRMPQAAFQGKGLLSTEGVVTVPDSTGRSLLAADSGFYEFLSETGEAHLAHEVLPGKEYEVVITTAGGLYRYRTGDCVKCECLVGDLPALRFIGRSALTSDMVGEKLTDEFVATCLDGIPGFRMLVPVIASIPRYVLVADERTPIPAAALLQTVESRLLANPQYAYARKIGQLDALTVSMVARPLEKYVRRRMNDGARVGDVKATSLRPETDWLESFRGNP